MASVFDVAAYILERRGRMTAMKLQKLVYYSQAWSLVWDGRPLFDDEVQAWVNGPVVYDLFKAHQGMFEIERADLGHGNIARLNAKATETIDAVLDYYGDKSSQWLSDLTHMEKPWLDARANLPEEARSGRVISVEAMRDYYSQL